MKKKKKKKIIIGVALIAAAIFIVIAFLLSSFKAPGEEAVSEEQQEQKNSLAQMERDAVISDLNSDASDEQDLDEETAERIMNLEVNIPVSIEEMYFDGDTKILKEELERYLVEEDFYMDVSWAKCSQTVTMDHLKNIVYLDFSINDKVGTTVTVTYYKEKGTFRFNYY